MTAYTLKMLRGLEVEPNSKGFAPDAHSAERDRLILAIQPDDYLNKQTTWLRETEKGWEIGPAPSGLELLPPDFDGSDLEFSGYREVMSVNQEDADDIRMFHWLVLIADQFDGHFTIMKFTTDWRIGWGTPKCSNELERRYEIEHMASGKTFQEAGTNALADARKTARDQQDC